MNFNPGSENPSSLAVSLTFLRKASVAFVLLIATLVLLGWQFNIPLLRGSYPGGPSTMKANTAFSFLLAGLSLGLLQLEPTLRAARLSRRSKLASTTFALCIILIGLLTLSQYLFGWNLGIDEGLFRDSDSLGTTLQPGRMGVGAALNFVLVGVNILILKQKFPSRDWFAQSLSCLIALIALLPFLGHLFGAPEFYELMVPTTSTSVHTSVLFIGLCIGLVFTHPDQGLMRTVTSPLAGGVMARWLLPWAIAIPLGINWCTFQGEQAGWYGHAFGYAGRVVLITGAFSTVIWRNARSLNQQEGQKQQFKRQLEESEDCLRQILQNMPVMLDAFDDTWKIIAWNQECERITGFSAQEVIQNPAIMERLYPNLAYREQMMTAWAKRGNNYRNWEWDITCKDGSTRTISWSNISDHFPVVGWAAWGIGVDVTGRKRVEAELRQLNAELEQRVIDRTLELQQQTRISQIMLDTIGEGVIIADKQGRFLLFNPAAIQLLGLGATDIPPEQWSQTYGLFLPDTETLFPSSELPLARALRGEAVDDVELFCRNSNKPGGAWVLCSSRPLKDEYGQLWAGVIVFHDITDRKQTEETLFRREREFRTLAENSPDVISRFDPALRYVYVSPSVEVATGIPPAVFIGKTHQELGFTENNIALWDTCVRQVFATGEAGLVEFSFPTPSGLRYYQSRVVPEVGRRDAIETVLVTSRDITEAKQAELELKQLTLKLEQSNQELQSFAYIASHDLKEPLRTTHNFCSLLKLKCKESLGEQGQDYIDRIQRATQQMQTLIDDLLTLSRVTTEAKPFAPVNLTHLLGQVVSSLDMQIQCTGGRVELGKLPVLYGDVTQLSQLFQNLISNGLKFHGQSPPLVKIYSANVIQASGEQSYQILVEDNGIGFEEHYQKRIFNAFERLHGRNEFEGTGIGLAICRKIVERHGGNITAQSALGLGATFIITLPISPA